PPLDEDAPEDPATEAQDPHQAAQGRTDQGHRRGQARQEGPSGGRSQGVGPPGVSAGASNATALMRQYLDVKARYPDAIVFFRLGDFYEMFYEDAVYVARTLSLTLTSRDKGKDDPVPMCGIPHHA